MSGADLSVSQMAKLAGCHRAMVLFYEVHKYIKSHRDSDNFRRYQPCEALKLKEFLATGIRPAGSEVPFQVGVREREKGEVIDGRDPDRT